MKKTGTFFGVGLGPGNPALLTLMAVETLRAADIIFTAASRNISRSVSGNIIASISGIKAERRELRFSMAKPGTERETIVSENAKLIAEELRKGKNCAFATIGDPMTYSTCGYLLTELKKMISGLNFKIVPGVNSWSALAAEASAILVEDTEELHIVPGYIVPENADMENILSEKNTTVLLKTYRSRNALLAKLKNRGSKILYGSNIGLPEQFISENPDETAARNDEYLSMIIIKDNEQRN